MTDTLETLRRKIGGATELESVVRTMKALAAASIVQYERAVHSLDDYYRTVELGLVAWLRHTGVAIYPAGGAQKNKGCDRRGGVRLGSGTGRPVQRGARGICGRQSLGGMPGSKHSCGRSASACRITSKRPACR